MSVLHDTPVRLAATGAQIGLGRARMTVQAFDGLTVISLSGDIDASNAEAVGEHIRGFVTPRCPIVLDLSDLDFLGVEGIRGLFALGETCADAKTGWALVTSHAVRRLLRVADRKGRVPAARSVTEALTRLHVRDRGRALVQRIG